jgi:hypothetical protein
VLWFGLCGTIETTLCLTKGEMLISCRLFISLLIGSTSGATYFRSRNERIWILDADFWMWLHEISTAWLLGGLLDDFMMLRRLAFFVFCQLIFIYFV